MLPRLALDLRSSYLSLLVSRDYRHVPLRLADDVLFHPRLEIYCQGDFRKRYEGLHAVRWVVGFIILEFIYEWCNLRCGFCL